MLVTVNCAVFPPKLTDRGKPVIKVCAKASKSPPPQEVS